MKLYLRLRPRTIRKRKIQPRAKAANLHYATHKEAARALVHERLAHYNQHYGFIYHRVSIKNTRSRWGSCSSLGNLNFNYKIIFLPAHLQDYIVVHELCHLSELNHSQAFWALVAEQVPNYAARIAELRRFRAC
jgi:predicted metal-dependent hydrolase